MAFEIMDFLDDIVSYGYALAGKPYVLNLVPYEVIPIHDVEGKHLIYDPPNMHFSSQEDLELRLKQFEEEGKSFIMKGKTDGLTTYALVADYDSQKISTAIPDLRYAKYFKNSK